VITPDTLRAVSMSNSSAGLGARYSDRELRQLQADEREWAPVREQLLALGTQAINDHVNSSGRCKQCQMPFPCAAAQQAELVLSAF
jgi:hypothetical protein